MLIKILEPLILFFWLIVILIYQFHEQTTKELKKINALGLIPNFHLFSPQPFLGRYILRYSIYSSLRKNEFLVENEEIEYGVPGNFLDSNRRIIKCVNNLCKRIATSTPTSNNLKLLVGFIKNELKNKGIAGRFEFYVYVKYPRSEKLLFKSRIYAV